MTVSGKKRRLRKDEKQAEQIVCGMEDLCTKVIQWSLQAEP